jgi:hypothetical protein
MKQHFLKLLLFALVLCAPLAVQAQAASIFSFMEKTCNWPHRTLTESIDQLDEWRLADDVETAFIADFVANSITTEVQLSARLPLSAVKSHGPFLRSELDKKLTAKLDNRNPARVLILKSNGSLALYLENKQTAAVHSVSCNLLIRGMKPDLVKGLSAPFKFTPSVSDTKNQSWNIMTYTQGKGGRFSYERVLTFHHQDKRTPQVAVLTFTSRFIVI